MSNLLEDLIDEYAQLVVEDADIDVLMNALKDTIVERMERDSVEEVIAEIEESSYDHLISDFNAEIQEAKEAK